MATITPTGVTPTTLTDYVNELNDLLTSAFGTLINLDPETPQGQLIGQLAFALSQYDEYVIDTINATSLYTAIGQQIDALAAALGIIRNAASATEVDVQLTGVPATFIDAGARASDTSQNQFTLKNPVTLNATGNGAGVMVASVTGPIVVHPGTLINIVDVVPGWETINNAQAGATGQNQEQDLPYKNRYFASVAINASSPAIAIRAALLAIPTVKQAIVPENFTNQTQPTDGIDLPPHSIAPVVIGGTDEEVGTAIALKKTLGCDMYSGPGTSSYSYLDPSSPIPQIVYFTRAVDVPIKISLSIRILDGFPGNGVELIKQSLASYFAQQKISQDVIYSRIYSPINQIPGHEIVNLEIGKVSGRLGTSDIPIILTEIATLDESNIDVQVVTL